MYSQEHNMKLKRNESDRERYEKVRRRIGYGVLSWRIRSSRLWLLFLSRVLNMILFSERILL